MACEKMEMVQEEQKMCKAAGRGYDEEEEEDVDMGGMFGGSDGSYGDSEEESNAAFAAPRSLFMEVRNKAVQKEEFKEVEATSEYMETHYYLETEVNNFKNLVEGNQFWIDFAQFLLLPVNERGAFLTSSFTQTAQSDRQIYLATMVLDLPETLSSSHDFVPNESSGVTIKAAGNMILFKKSLAEADLKIQ